VLSATVGFPQSGEHREQHICDREKGAIVGSVSDCCPDLHKARGRT
jgi:hypothetical protein